jgi:predicted membrane protein
MQKHLCNPALLYVIFASVQIIFDLFNQMWMLAITKSFVAIIFTFVLNMLCVNGMSMISWILVIIPFLFTLLLVEILIFILGFTSVTALENDSESKNNNKNNNKNQFIDISYAETPHIEQIEQIEHIEQLDDFNMDS